jgi:hypothetical protein
MSAESQPDPILPNYNPSSWDVPTLSAEERAILDTEYITFPIAQNQNITFPVAPTAPTLANGTNTTQVATTGFVQNAIAAFKAAPIFWSALNTFNGGLSASSITRTGTLTITGTPLALSGTRLDTGITPNLTYSSTTGLGAGFIGEVLTDTVASVAIPTTANTPINVSSLSVPAGVWILTGTCSQPLNNTTGTGNYMKLAISPTTDSYTNAQGGQLNRLFNTTTVGVATVSSTTIVSNSTATTWYLVAQSALITGNFTLISFTITRVA